MKVDMLDEIDDVSDFLIRLSTIFDTLTLMYNED